MSYEDLDKDLVATTRGILEFLGIGDPVRTSAIAPRHRRQADELSQQWIEQYRTRASDD